MVAITATSYATVSVASSRAEVQVARKQAEQDQAEARQLRSQAQEAEQQAQQSQARLRTATAQMAQADSTYSSQLLRQAAGSDAQRLQSFLAPVAAVASNQYRFPSNPLQSSSGRLVDLMA